MSVPPPNFCDLDDKIFDSEGRPRVEIQDVLVRISSDVISEVQGMDIPLKVCDVWFVGSLMGPGWDEESDIDLHIIYDESIYPQPGLAKGFFAEFKSLFSERGIEVANREVEVYFQALEDPMYTPGVFSLMSREYLYTYPYEIVVATPGQEEEARYIAQRMGELVDLARKDPQA